jgi:hypothetical protein
LEITMARSTVSRALLCALLFLSLAPVPALAGCKIAIVSTISPTDPNGTATHGQITFSTVGTPAGLQRESTMERPSDVLVYDDPTVSGINCFTPSNRITIGYSALLSNPASVQVTPANFDIYDSNGAGGLSISAHSTTGFTANGQTTIVEIDVLGQGTPAAAAGGITANPVGSAIRVKNLRFDATLIANGGTMTINVSAPIGMPNSFTGVVGVVNDTVAPGAAVTQQGVGSQSAGDTLTTPEIFDYAENYGGAFRLASQNASGVSGDVPTTATRVIYDLGTSLPWGVSVNFPSKIQVGGAAGLTLTLRSGGSCNGPVQCTAVYDTTANGIGIFDLETTTAATPNTGEDGKSPAIGVFIANPSGYGTANLTISVVPSHITTIGDAPVKVLSISLMGSGATTTTSGVSIGGISPSNAVAGAAATTLTVTGSGFTSSSVVQWNGSPRATTFVSSAQLTAAISSADLAAAGNATVTVVNGTTLSNAATFAITTNPKSSSPFQYVLPHVTSGNGYASKVTIVNVSGQQNTVVVNFVSQAGATLSSNTYTMAPGATLRVAMTDAERFGATVTKWATVGSTAPVLANVWYDYQSQGSTAVQNSVGFNDAPPLTDFTLPAEFQPGVNGVDFGKTIGLALANPNGVAATATVKLVDSTGAVVATQTVNLPAYGQTAIDLQQSGGFASALPSGDFVGSITVSATQPLSSIAVQGNDGLFSAVPVGLGRAK